MRAGRPRTLSAETVAGLRAPVPGSAFVERAGELAAVSRLLARSRVTTLTGPAGIGKTRLALEAAARDRHPDGVAWISLAAIADPSRVAVAVAHGLGLWPRAGQEVAQCLVAHMAEQRALLVLDNCEHVLVACAELVDAVISACPGVTVLATSQAPLGLGSERTHAVPALSLPPPAAAREEIERCEAVALFAQRAASAHRGFAITDEVAPAVAEICRRLDGIPLAIELAAARVAVIAPAEIAELLGDCFAVLTGGQDALLDRHRTLQGALDWSYDLLPAPEQALLRRLSVFPLDCSLKAVCRVTGDRFTTPQEVARLLGQLVSKSLLLEELAGSQPRYRLLEIVRAYAANRLRETGEIAESRRRHAHWCLDLAQRGEPHLTGRVQLSWLDALETEHPNLLAALEWAVEHRESEISLRLSGALIVFWRARGHYQEGRRRLEAALALGGDRRGLPAATALWGVGLLAHMLGDDHAARPAIEESLALAIAAGSDRARGRALLVLGNILMQSGSEAWTAFSECRELANRARDWWCLAHAQALSAGLMEDAASAARTIEECLRLTRRTGDHQSRCVGLYMLGSLEVLRGDLGAAEEAGQSCLIVARRIGDPYAESAAMELLGEVAIGKHEISRGKAWLEGALALGRDARFDVSGKLNGLGSIACAQGDLVTAGARFREAARRAQDDSQRLHSDMGLGFVAAAQGNLAAADRHFEEGLRRARATRDRRAIPAGLDGLAYVACSGGDPAGAVTLYLEALDVRRRIGNHPGVAESLEGLTRAAVHLRRYTHGARLLGAAESVRATTGWNSSFMPWPYVEIHRMVTELGRDRFDRLRAEGAGFSPEQAVAYAMRFPSLAGRPRCGWASLTRAERAVVGLAELELTNAGIGKRLNLSRRTVERHLYKVFRKLGITSRHELRGAVSGSSRRPAENVGM